jgi:hypothetical protein
MNTTPLKPDAVTVLVKKTMNGANKMIEHAHTFGFLMFALYGAIMAIVIFSQEILRKAQLEVSDGALLPVAFGLTMFSGVLSYVIFVKEKHTKFELHDGFIHIGSSLLVAITLGFALSGYVETNHWLLTIVIGAFFKDICLFAFRKATKKRLSVLTDEKTDS